VAYGLAWAHAAGRLKPVWLDEAAIRAHLEREYAPD
jgi:hypothetical protein